MDQNEKDVTHDTVRKDDGTDEVEFLVFSEVTSSSIPSMDSELSHIDDPVTYGSVGTPKDCACLDSSEIDRELALDHPIFLYDTPSEDYIKLKNRGWVYAGIFFRGGGMGGHMCHEFVHPRYGVLSFEAQCSHLSPWSDVVEEERNHMTMLYYNWLFEPKGYSEFWAGTPTGCPESGTTIDELEKVMKEWDAHQEYARKLYHNGDRKVCPTCHGHGVVELKSGEQRRK